MKPNGRGLVWVTSDKTHVEQVWPVRPFDIHRSPDGRFTLRFANLAPKEEFQIEILSGRMPDVLNVRCAEQVGKMIPLRIARRLPRSFVITIWFLIALGFAATIYIVLRVGGYILSLAVLHASPQ